MKEKGKRIMANVKEKVSLTEFAKEDIALKVEWINDPENSKYLHYDLPLTLDKTYEWFCKKQNESRIDLTVRFEGRPVGIIGLIGIDEKNKKAEYYVTVGEKDCKRKGIALRATELLLERAFFDLKLNKIYLNVDEENSAACSLYEKAGFVCEGVFKEELFEKGRAINRKRYAILRAEFEERTGDAYER